MRTPKRLTQPTQMDLKLSTSQSNDLLLSVMMVVKSSRKHTGLS